MILLFDAEQIASSTLDPASQMHRLVDETVIIRI
jgi:hypothetical protein